MKKKFSQLPTERLFWKIRWRNYGIGSDIISAASANASDPLAVISQITYDNSVEPISKLMLTGGAPGTFSNILLHVDTVGGQHLEIDLPYECLTNRPIKQEIEQYPTEYVPYGIDWTTRDIGSTLITAAAFACADPAVNISNVDFINNPQQSIFTLNGGIYPIKYNILGTVDLADGQRMQENILYETLTRKP